MNPGTQAVHRTWALEPRRPGLKKSQEQYIVDENGRKTAVVLPVKEYQELLEDLHDLAVIAERRDEPTTSFEELKKRLKEDGLL